MKVTYLRKQPSRVGQTVLLKGLEEGEMGKWKYGHGRRQCVYYRFHNGYAENATRKRKPNWISTYYTESDIKNGRCDYLGNRKVEIIS